MFTLLFKGLYLSTVARVCKVKQKYGERDAIMFFTVQNKQVEVLRGSITERDYERLYQWAIQHFPET